MDYKVKLQNNNNVFRGNNTDLQAVLETINNLPEAGVSENLDEEITTQEEKIASQDELIASIAAALEGKAAGGSGAEIDTCTVEFEADTGCSVYLTIIENNVSSIGEYAIAKYIGLTQENILCNSLAFINSNVGGGEITNILVDGEIANTLYRSSEFGIIIIPSKKNETVVVSISNPV